MLKHLKVENIRSYEDLDILFKNGVTVISGVNGSGKSSLLEACFTGLFGSKTLSKDFTIADIVRKGATKASILLEFEQKSDIYCMEQVFRNDPESGRASNTRSVLKINGQIFTDQAKRTYDSILLLLRMDEEAFRNCVYIRQGEIDVLINAKPAERQKMIDDLLQIGKLEDYRERAGNARIGVGRHQRDTERRIKEVKNETAEIEGKDPVANLNRLLTEAAQIKEKHVSVSETRDKTRSRIEEFRSKLGEYEQLALQKKSIATQILGFNTKKTEAFGSINNSTSSIQSLRSHINELKQSVSSIKEQMVWDGDVEQMLVHAEEQERVQRDKLNYTGQKKALHLQNIENADRTLQQLSNQIKDINLSIESNLKKKDEATLQIEKLKASLESTQAEKLSIAKEIESLGFTPKKLSGLEDIIELVQAQQKTLHGDKMKLFTQREETKKRIDKSKELMDQGKCPTCGQDLHGSAMHETIQSDEEHLASLEKELDAISKKEEDFGLKMEQLKQVKVTSRKMEDYDIQVKSFNEKIDLSQKILNDHASRMDEDKNRLNEAVSHKQEIEITIAQMKEQEQLLQEALTFETKKHAETMEKLNIAKKAKQNLIESENKGKDIEKLEERIRSEQEKIGLLEQQIKDGKQRLSEIDEKMGGIDAGSLKSLLQQYEAALKKIEMEIKKLEEKRTELIKQIGMTEKEIERLSRLQQELRSLVHKSDFLGTVYKDAEELESMYIRIRAELRSRNVGTLDTLINEIFSFMYSNNAYSHVQLDSEYNLTVFGKDGTPLEPKLLSGGERAIFNLVLRCAIYRLLSMAMGGPENGSSLPPLIMDEPTVFLDRGHVQQLIKLIDLMRDFGVGQIIIVSHDEALIDSADHLFYVEKDPITNTSAITAR
ncbi:MAG: AAA family ATPase [Methanomethylovorans sp.]|uniref:AAA family ATPase n=1 Tax=Methanomethylovorans sp. TaxID=2758717 RepID=UPI0035313CF5